MFLFPPIKPCAKTPNPLPPLHPSPPPPPPPSPPHPLTPHLLTPSHPHPPPISCTLIALSACSLACFNLSRLIFKLVSFLAMVKLALLKAPGPFVTPECGIVLLRVRTSPLSDSNSSAE